MATIPHGELVRRCAAVFLAFNEDYDDEEWRELPSLQWAAGFIAEHETAPHKGDCELAEHQGPVTCSRCVADEFLAKARAALRPKDRLAIVDAPPEEE